LYSSTAKLGCFCDFTKYRLLIYLSCNVAHHEREQAMIKHPTIRKVRNRGFTPVVYHTDRGQLSCWIEKTGTKRLHVRFTDGTMRRVPKSEQRYMRAL